MTFKEEIERLRALGEEHEAGQNYFRLIDSLDRLSGMLSDLTPPDSAIVPIHEQAGTHLLLAIQIEKLIGTLTEFHERMKKRKVQRDQGLVEGFCYLSGKTFQVRPGLWLTEPGQREMITIHEWYFGKPRNPTVGTDS